MTVHQIILKLILITQRDESTSVRRIKYLYQRLVHLSIYTVAHFYNISVQACISKVYIYYVVLKNANEASWRDLHFEMLKGICHASDQCNKSSISCSSFWCQHKLMNCEAWKWAARINETSWHCFGICFLHQQTLADYLIIIE